MSNQKFTKTKNIQNNYQERKKQIEKYLKQFHFRIELFIKLNIWR